MSAPASVLSDLSHVVAPAESAGWVPWLAAGASAGSLLVLDLPLGYGVIQTVVAFTLAWMAVRVCYPMLPAAAWESSYRTVPAERRTVVRREADREVRRVMTNIRDERATRILRATNDRVPAPAPAPTEKLAAEPRMPKGLARAIGAMLDHQSGRCERLRSEMKLLSSVRHTIRRAIEAVTMEINGDYHATGRADESVLDLLGFEETPGLREHELRTLRRELDAIRREANRQHRRAATPPFQADTGRTLAAARQALIGWLLDTTDAAQENLTRRERDVVHQLRDQRELVQRMQTVHGLMMTGELTAVESTDVVENLFDSLDAIETEQVSPHEPIVVDDNDGLLDDGETRHLAPLHHLRPGLQGLAG